MIGHRHLSRFYVSAVLSLVVVTAAGCAKSAPRGVPVTPAAASAKSPATAWPPAYTAAIADALDPQPSEISTTLVAIVRSNPMLVWKTFPDGKERVLVTSLVGDTSPFPPPGNRYNTGANDVWITAVPQMRNACTQPGWAKGDLAMRLRQSVGLTPTDTVTAFVDFWVLPEQLFRPAADNNITTTTAGLTMPANTETWYRTWFNQLRSHQYFQSTVPANDAYPWTELGYTYDWGSDQHQGMSEFVIKQRSDVFINAITPYQTYCASTGQ